jgi:hypothetical protein
MSNRIKVKTIANEEVPSQDVALVYWLQSKRRLRERREHEAREKAERTARQEKASGTVSYCRPPWQLAAAPPWQPASTSTKRRAVRAAGPHGDRP